MPYADNPQLQLAYDFVQYTNRNVFLTGRAGTGKTTFLKRIKQLTPKRMVVLAPTGVAAINAGGMTIHSFFQLPFGPFLPGYAQAEGGKNKYKFSKRKIDIIRNLQLHNHSRIGKWRISSGIRHSIHHGLAFGCH